MNKPKTSKEDALLYTNCLNILAQGFLFTLKGFLEKVKLSRKFSHSIKSISHVYHIHSLSGTICIVGLLK